MKHTNHDDFRFRQKKNFNIKPRIILMPNYYLDIETTGLDEHYYKIITIQYQQLERNSARPVGDLVILKEWESDEKTILEQFYAESGIMDRFAFSFVPVGFNLGFEHKFLWQRSIANGISPVDILNLPFIDLKSVGVLMNRGEFKGAGLDKLTAKPHSGTAIPQWYEQKNYAAIEDYIKKEAQEFTSFCSWLYQEMPHLLDKYKNHFQ